MFCKKCGKEIADDAVFCPECGEKVVWAQKEKAVTVSHSKEKKKKSHKGLFVCLALLVLVLAVLTTWLMYPYTIEKKVLNNGGYYISKRYKKPSYSETHDNKVWNYYLEISRAYYDGAGKPCMDDYGWHKYTWEYNSGGQKSETYCYGMGKDYELYVEHDGNSWSRYDRYGNLKGNRHGIAKVSYNDWGDVSLFGIDGKPMICTKGWSRRVLEEWNGYTYKRISYYGTDGNLTNCSEGWSSRIVDENRISYYGADGKYTNWSTNNKFSGWAVCEMKSDGLYLYDAGMRPVNCKAGWQSLTKEKEGKGKMALFFCDRKGNSVMGDPDAGTGNLGKEGCFAFSIYVNHDDSPEGYTVWYDQDGKFLKGDESVNEEKNPNHGTGFRRTPGIVPWGWKFEKVDDDFYRDYIDAMFWKLKNSYDSRMGDELWSCVASPDMKSKEANEKKSK